MTDAVRLRRCRGCGKKLPITAFETDNGVIHRICTICFEQRKIAIAASKHWDWASALDKQTHMSASLSSAFDSDYSCLIVPDTYRAIMLLQEYRCALTGEEFHLPPPGHLKSKETLSKWQRTLPLALSGRVPVAVRIDPDRSWEPGNIMLIAYKWYHAYIYSANMCDFRMKVTLLCNHVTNTFSHRDVLNAMQTIVTKRQEL